LVLAVPAPTFAQLGRVPPATGECAYSLVADAQDDGGVAGSLPGVSVWWWT
jgi:hypothetical protein